VLKDAASKISAPQPTPTYYHFAFPNANRMMLIADESKTNIVDTNSFNLNPPSTAGFEYFEWSWSLGSLLNKTYDTFVFNLNGTEIDRVSYGIIKYGIFSSVQPIIGQENIVTMEALPGAGYSPRGTGGLAIIYKVP
jgi:hypothetical protein